MSDAPRVGVTLAIALLALLGIAVAAARIGRIPIARNLVTASARAVVQLAAVSLIIAAALAHTWTALLVTLGMFTVATLTAAGRDQARPDTAWIGLALATGIVPVLAVIFALGTTPFTGPAIVPIAGIVTGGAMTAHTLTARRAFDTLRTDHGQVDAALALGMGRHDAIALVITRHTREALNPALDQTRTVGLVTLPGAYVGVLLGGGSAADAAAAQLLVLIGLLAAETCVAEATRRLIAAGRILPTDVRATIPRR
jgi:putative ABC transport system permease protein